jgi:hypothetical protein
MDKLGRFFQITMFNHEIEVYIVEFNQKVRMLLGARALMDDNDPRIKEKWEELAECLGENEQLTILFFKTTTKREIELLSDIFEDISYRLQSKAFIDLLHQLDKNYPDLKLSNPIKWAEEALN